MTFWREPATKRDLIGGGAVLAVCIVLVIFAAVVAAIRLHDETEQTRDELEHERAARVELAAENERLGSELVEVRDDGQATAARAATTAGTVKVLRRRVRVLGREPASGAPAAPTGTAAVGAAPSPESGSAPVSGVRAPRGERPGGRRRTRPDRPGRPSLPRPAPPIVLPPPPVVAPPIAPTPAPPIVTTPPRPGNKPPGAPCPPRNPNCG